jgi:2-iminobutanoate/2-iminopropanoate deaminase/2-aminomuconate deaminase
MSPLRSIVDVGPTDKFMPFAPVIRVASGGDLLFIAGATALPLQHDHPHRHDELDPPDDAAEQTRLVMENLTRCLETAGASWADVVRTDMFLTNMDDQDAIGEVMARYLGGHIHTSTMVEVSRLVDPRLKVEISAIAVIPGEERAELD